MPCDHAQAGPRAQSPPPGLSQTGLWHLQQQREGLLEMPLPHRRSPGEMSMRAVLLLCVVSACVSLGDEEPYPSFVGGEGGGFAAVEAVFDRQCNFCHTGAAPSGDLDLENGAGLFLEDGSERPAHTAACSGLPQVRPFQPDESCLWILVRDGAMPPGGRLPGSDKETIRSWIEEGAELPSLQDR